MKFGLVGVIAFIIDWGILNLLVGVFRMHNVLAATISFIISLIFNYIASMKLVFKHRDDMARWMEILIFVIGALIGLFMNDAIIWISTYGMNHDAYVSQSTEYLIRTNVGKLIATAVVMVWNFLTRKWLLDDTHTNAMNRLRKADNRLTPEELEAARAENQDRLSCQVRLAGDQRRHRRRPEGQLSSFLRSETPLPGRAVRRPLPEGSPSAGWSPAP